MASANLELRFELTYKNAMNDSTLSDSAKFFSQHYGVYSARGTAPGSPVTITAARLKHDLWPAAVKKWQDLCLVQAFYDGDGDGDDSVSELVGQAFVAKWRWKEREVLWVPHLCVAQNHRHKGIAARLIEQIREEEPVLFKGGSASSPAMLVGIQCANPAALQAIAKGLSKSGSLGGALAENAYMDSLAGILEAGPLEFLRRGRIVGDQSPGAAGGPAILDTGLFIEHPEGTAMVEKLQRSGAPFKNLPEGCEYVGVFEGA